MVGKIHVHSVSHRPRSDVINYEFASPACRITSTSENGFSPVTGRHNLPGKVSQGVCGSEYFLEGVCIKELSGGATAVARHENKSAIGGDSYVTQVGTSKQHSSAYA